MPSGDADEGAVAKHLDRLRVSAVIGLQALVVLVEIFCARHREHKAEASLCMFHTTRV
jgi:hypothetical protein